MSAKNHISIEEMEGRAAGGRLGRELRQELVDEAIDQVRSGVAVGELPGEVREALTDGLIDELLSGRRGEQEILGPGGLLGDLTRRLVERAMAAELTEHVGYEPHHEPPGGTGNPRNGDTPKTLLTDHGPVRIKTRATATARSSRRSCPRASAASRAWTTRSWRCRRAG